MKRCVACSTEFQDYEDCPKCFSEEYSYLPENIDVSGVVNNLENKAIIMKYNLRPAKVHQIKRHRK